MYIYIIIIIIYDVDICMYIVAIIYTYIIYIYMYIHIYTLQEDADGGRLGDSAFVTETKRHSPNTGALANNALQVTRPPPEGSLLVRVRANRALRHATHR